MFTRHTLGPANKLDCPRAMGTDAFSPQRAESFRRFLLLPPPHSTPSLALSRSGQAPFDSFAAVGRIGQWRGCRALPGWTAEGRLSPHESQPQRLKATSVSAALRHPSAPLRAG